MGLITMPRSFGKYVTIIFVAIWLTLLYVDMRLKHSVPSDIIPINAYPKVLMFREQQIKFDVDGSIFTCEDSFSVNTRMGSCVRPDGQSGWVAIQDLKIKHFKIVGYQIIKSGNYDKISLLVYFENLK